MAIIDLHISKQVFNAVYFPTLFDYSKRYRVYYGSAGSGKSHFIAQRLIIKACNDKRKILCLRKVGTGVKESVFQLLLNQLSYFQILDQCKVNKSTFTITLPNNSVFLCSGLDDPEKLKSITDLTDIWMEESTEFTQYDFNQLDLRLRHPRAAGQEIILSFNPTSKLNWVYKLFFKDDFETAAEAAAIEADFRSKAAIMKTTYKDNRFLPASYIDSLMSLKTTNPTYFRIYALGEFCSLDRLVFNNWEIGSAEAPKDSQLLIGLDFGYINDPSALIVSYLDEDNKTIYIVDEVYKKGLLNNEIANLIIYKGYAKETIIADSAEQKSIEEIKRAGVPRIRAAAKGKGSVLQGIQKLQQYKLIVSPVCENTIIELENYSWRKDKKTDEYI